MVKIRTITYSFPENMTQELYDKVATCVQEWNKGEYGVHTQRITLPVRRTGSDDTALAEVWAFCQKVGIRWFNAPMDPWLDKEFSADRVVDILSKYDGAFCNILCCKDKSIDEEILVKTAETITKVADISADGSANFRLGASMNVKPNGPFFPFTYSDGAELSFSVGLEITKDMNRLLTEHETVDLTELRQEIVAHFEPQIRNIKTVAEAVAEKIGIKFSGIDFSLAPLPEEGSSVIAILNKLGIHKMNDVGVLFATAYLTNILKIFAAKYPSVGFSGVMYSLLEDQEYAKHNDSEGMSIDKMIAMSTMCGCGVDMVPIDKTQSDDILRTVLMEVACVSSRLDKPLGVRILPVSPNADGKTDIQRDGDFIVNTKILSGYTNRLAGFSGIYSFVGT